MKLLIGPCEKVPFDSTNPANKMINERMIKSDKIRIGG